MASLSHRRALGLALLCSMVGFYALLGIPASAHTPTRNNQHFAPDEFLGDGHDDCAGGAVPNHCSDGDPSAVTKEGEVLSDANDGFGEAYELRAVSDTTASFYEWYSCTQTPPFPTSPGAQCQPIATDTVADVSAAPPGSPVVHAWSGSFNIGAAGGQEGTPRDLHGSACASDARPGGPPIDASHCVLGTVPLVPPPPGDAFADNVHLDDSSTTSDHSNTSSGRIHMLIDGPSTDQRVFSDVAVHGAGLRNGQTITIIGFSSSPSVDAVAFCWDQGSNSTTPNNQAPPGSGFPVGACTHQVNDTTGTAGGGTACHALAPQVSGADCWTTTLSFPNANAEFGLSMIEFDDGDPADGITESGSGDCVGDTAVDPGPEGDDCQLDKIYVTTTISGEAVPGATPSPTTTPGAPPAVPADCIGTAEDDLLIGTNGQDVCRGLGGDDVVRTLKGADIATGNSGNDVLRLGDGKDIGRGGDGDDLVIGGNGSDTIRLFSGDDVGKGGPGPDGITGGSGTDSCNGGAGRDVSHGCEFAILFP